MVGLLRKGMDLDEIKKLNDQLQTLEAEADHQILELYRDAYANETDPIRYLEKWICLKSSKKRLTAAAMPTMLFLLH